MYCTRIPGRESAWFVQKSVFLALANCIIRYGKYQRRQRKARPFSRLGEAAALDAAVEEL